MMNSCNNPIGSVCSNKMVRNGKTGAKKTRWRCKTCGAYSKQNRQYITRQKPLQLVMKRLLSFFKQETINTPHEEKKK